MIGPTLAPSVEVVEIGDPEKTVGSLLIGDRGVSIRFIRGKGTSWHMRAA